MNIGSLFPKNNLLYTLSVIALLLLCFAAVFCPIFSSYTYYDIHLEYKNTPPCSRFFFGTDELGRDIFTRIWLGARISLCVGILAALIDVIVGVLYGAIAGLLGGKTEEYMMRLADTLYAIPYLLFVILFTVMLGPSLLAIILALTITGWIGMARIVRSRIVQLRQADFVKASFAMGASRMWVLWKHLLPNSLGQILVTMTLTIPSSIFAESFLSFLGLGIQAPLASWGSMASDGLPALAVYPWRLLFPAGFLSFTLICFSLVTEGIRSRYNPQEQNTL